MCPKITTCRAHFYKQILIFAEYLLITQFVLRLDIYLYSLEIGQTDLLGKVSSLLFVGKRK